MKPFCATPIPNKHLIDAMKGEELDSSTCSEKEILKPPSRRSVRIETPSEKNSNADTPDIKLNPKARSPYKKMFSPTLDIPWDIEYLDVDRPLESQSAPSSPTRSKENIRWKDTITIPKPFQMTVR